MINFIYHVTVRMFQIDFSIIIVGDDYDIRDYLLRVWINPLWWELRVRELMMNFAKLWKLMTFHVELAYEERRKNSFRSVILAWKWRSFPWTRRNFVWFDIGKRKVCECECGARYWHPWHLLGLIYEYSFEYSSCIMEILLQQLGRNFSALKLP